MRWKYSSASSIIDIVLQFGVDAMGIFRMEVVDTGVGLTAEDQKRIFGEFTQFNKGELHGGGDLKPSYCTESSFYNSVVL